MSDDDLHERLRTLTPEEQRRAISADMDQLDRFVRQGRAAKAAVDEASASQRAVDLIARLAEAWDGSGRVALVPPFEHQALLALAALPSGLGRQRWDQLDAAQRQSLLVAARRMVTLGRACAWVFGEGRGA